MDDRKVVVIAGGGSFLASGLLSKIDLSRYRVLALVREIPQRSMREGIEYIQVDMQQYDKLDRYVEHCDIYIPFTWDGTKKQDRNNREKNENSCRCIFDSIRVMVEKCGCKKVILPGTFSEYKNDHKPIDESTECESDLEYGKYKNRLYRNAYEYCEKKDVLLIELRLFSIYGAGDDEAKMLEGMIKKMLCDEPIMLTRAEQIWDFVHVDDIAELFLILLDKDLESGCYNVASSAGRTLKSYLEEARAITGSKSRMEYGAIPYEKDEVPHVICVTDKLKKATNWKPKISFADGIREMIVCDNRSD
jgi:nucleoside-diphosphate-sugar epimerase